MSEPGARTAQELEHDLDQRRRALDLSQAFIVRAPAGSGKTDLLTRRLLKLLATVDEPEEILAITFTRAATAEMRSRVLKHLEEAAAAPDFDPEEDERITLARAALAHSEQRGWRLLEQPHRLTIETIDSLCLRIAHGQPLLSRMGGRLAPTEHAAPLYALAARRTLGRLGGSDAALNEALQHLLNMRDNSLPDCENLISGMLAQRDQWLRVFPLGGSVEWEFVRSQMEQPFRREVKRVLAEAHQLLMAEPVLATQLLELANYACENGNGDVALLAGLRSLPAPESLPVDHWRCISNFLLTASGEWRKPKGLNKNRGFPSANAEHKRQKQQMEYLLDRLGQTRGLDQLLRRVRELPLPRYDEDQWQTLQHLFMTLRRAVAELRVIFAERNEVDFTELGIAAREVLGDENASPDLLLALSGGLRHLLIDEFQDTSRSQHELVRLLLRAWDEGDGRTCFLVGDPMQSIYMFRQAEVELFGHVEQHGIVSEEYTVSCCPIQLSTNFRSHAGLTDKWNVIFEKVFQRDGATGVPFSPSYASVEALPVEAVQVHPQIIGTPDRKVTPEDKKLVQEGEAWQVLDIIDSHQPAIAQALANGEEYRVAVLVRARQHLAKIVKLLRERGIAFRAVELETLAERQELLDLLSLTRALLHPMDRVAWLSVLRAPWCGLRLRDLHLLTGADNREWKRRPMLELIEQHLPLLDSDAAERTARTVAILKQALATRFQGPHATSFSQWIERTWRSLGGPSCVDAAAYENVQVYFSMLDEIAPDGMACMTEDFEAEFARLYAQPDPTVSERAGVQLMTIHKAKGLGFDVVIVPGLERKPASDHQVLISSLERTNASTGEDEILVAPIGIKGGEKHPTYRWVQKQREARFDDEIKRLLYVACTRARRELHLLGTATMSATGLKPGDAKSLLAVGWPAFEKDFAEAALDRRSEDDADNVVSFAEPNVDDEVGLDLAAVTESAPPLILKRIASGAKIAPAGKNVTITVTDMSIGQTPNAFVRPEGSRHARIVGTAVHALLDLLSRGAEFSSLPKRARNLLRAAAFSGRVLEDAAQEVLAAVENCVKDAEGNWILQQHAGAQSETSWSGWVDGRLQTLRADRIFRAGSKPLEAGSDHLWVIDYKMSAPAGEPMDEFLARQRDYYAPQLARYAEALQKLEGDTIPVRLGLYYPRVTRFDWWSNEN
jgi:ATP-dependent helicase/nuclease subunit A